MCCVAGSLGNEEMEVVLRIQTTYVSIKICVCCVAGPEEDRMVCGAGPEQQRPDHAAEHHGGRQEAGGATAVQGPAQQFPHQRGVQHALKGRGSDRATSGIPRLRIVAEPRNSSDGPVRRRTFQAANMLHPCKQLECA